MATIIFYEKPGCLNGEKQKTILEAAGHTLQCVDILSFPWSREKLMAFVIGNTPVEMMNHTAPAVKNGDIIPEQLTFNEALDLMLMHPILIKRPLIVVEGMMIQGFMNPDLRPYLGAWDSSVDVVTCPNLQSLSCDEQKRGNK